MIKLQAPENATSASFDGVTYEVENGFISVPEEAAVGLVNHGFTVAVEKKPKTKAAE